MRGITKRKSRLIDLAMRGITKRKSSVIDLALRRWVIGMPYALFKS